MPLNPGGGNQVRPICKKAYGCETGGGAGCVTCKPQDERTSHVHCATCNSGYYISGTGCQAYGCETGGGAGCVTCKPQDDRTSHVHCATCNSGYYISGTGCQ